jgi:large-conductance mechanosensitive channel
MAPRRKTNVSPESNSNMVLGNLSSMFGFQQVNICTSDDGSFYCQLMRLVQMIIAFIVISTILYFLYLFLFRPMINSVFMKGGSRSLTKR